MKTRAQSQQHLVVDVNSLVSKANRYSQLEAWKCCNIC